MKTISVLILLFMAGNCHAFFGLPSLELFNKKTTEIQTELSAVKVGQATANTDISAIKSSIGELNIKVGQVNAEISAKVSAVDKSVNSSIKSGRDTNTVNDSRLFEIQKESYEYQVKIWKYLFCAVFGLLAWVVKAMFREMSNARFYQTSIAKLSKNGEFDDIMRTKKELEKEKSLWNKLRNFKNGTKNPSKLE